MSLLYSIQVEHASDHDLHGKWYELDRAETFPKACAHALIRSN